MDNTDKYGFQPTSLTLVEKLARGEDWERFCTQYYEPIKNKFNAINRKGGKPQIDEGDVDDAISAIILKLELRLQTSYDPKRGRLRDWLSAVVGNAISDYRKEMARNREIPLPEDDSSITSGELVDNRDYRPTSGDEEWTEFLFCSSFTMAKIGRPWSKKVKPIIKEITKERMLKMRDEDIPEDLTDAAIARRFKITEMNLRKIRSRFMKEVRKLYDAFKKDDPAFFETMQKNNKTYDELLDEYLHEVGHGEDVSIRREEFKAKHGEILQHKSN